MLKIFLGLFTGLLIFCSATFAHADRTEVYVYRTTDHVLSFTDSWRTIPRKYKRQRTVVRTSWKAIKQGTISRFTTESTSLGTYKYKKVTTKREAPVCEQSVSVLEERRALRGVSQLWYVVKDACGKVAYEGTQKPKLDIRLQRNLE